eukprot:jgi/Mesvir1/12510/Mv06297-RA.1
MDETDESDNSDASSRSSSYPFRSNEPNAADRASFSSDATYFSSSSPLSFSSPSCRTRCRRLPADDLARDCGAARRFDGREGAVFFVSRLLPWRAQYARPS